jgi:predicted Zn-dependent peptidase
VYAGYESLKHSAAVFCYAGTSADRAQQTLDVTLAELRRLTASGVEAEELDTMRAGLKSSLIMQQESSLSRSGSLASDWYFLGRVRSLDEIASALDALTPAAVSQFAASLPLDDLTMLTLGPAALAWPN